MQPILLSLNEAAEALSMSKTKLYSEMKLGKIPGLKAGKKTLIKRADIETYIENLDVAFPCEQHGA